MRWGLLAFMVVGAVLAQDKFIVQIDEFGNTIPTNSVATPQQVTMLGLAASAASARANSLASKAQHCEESLLALGTNLVVTSTVYVRSIGGMRYDDSAQTITIRGIDVGASNVTIVATVAQVPLVQPVLDWRASLTDGGWTNIAATVSEVAIPQGVTNAAAAYRFVLPRPDSDAQKTVYFRVVDNSTGVSGSGLWWIVFGGIVVDGVPGITADIQLGGDQLKIKGGIVVEATPLGELP